METKDGYIVDLSLDEAIKIFDDLYLDQARARGNGKTRMLYNNMRAWIKIKEALADIPHGEATRIHLDPEKERLIFKLGVLVKPDTYKLIWDDLHNQYKAGLVVMPPYMNATVVPKETEMILEFKEEKSDA